MPSGTLSDRLSTHLQVIHSTVVDTSVLFPHRLGLPYKRSLRNLMADYLRQIIQDNGECWGTGTWGPWGLWGLQAPGPDTSVCLQWTGTAPARMPVPACTW